ncbi:peptide-methionine (R)-S-oxide reductase MsrB [Zooshikella harenae]|uniref:Peptide methionine sulfoxide reductase MsrB n=1 Tax=Zooshikella harenae TaxID=2827238 RepID=A0ABS5ZDN9_9GAMM|nr:peptide-methionine (R)-S-oxide reductase MsrB [Zooshikella harenae]MBU2712189.1 peptide-methionine (R)-S-oxide reductase MsrB [Zooshikella harenae]
MVKNKKAKKSLQEWQQQLTPEQYRICREKGTEPAFSGEYLNMKDEGVYCCVCCGQRLFDSATKYDSGSGWPSYYQPIAKEVIDTNTDHSHGMMRTEVMCSQCEAHLGHVFPDGPQPTGLRYCINSASLCFTTAKSEPTKEDGK